jgi:hypothetical protein
MLLGPAEGGFEVALRWRNLEELLWAWKTGNCGMERLMAYGAPEVRILYLHVSFVDFFKTYDHGSRTWKHRIPKGMTCKTRLSFLHTPMS